MTRYSKTVFQNVVPLFIFFTIVLLKEVENKADKCSTEPPVVFTNAGIFPFKKTDVAWTIYVTVQNIGDSPLHVVGRMHECCEMIGEENDCVSMRIIGGSMGIVQPEQWKNVTFLFPNMYLYNRKGECSVEIWYKDRGNTTDFISATVSFDTYVRSGAVPASMKMWGPLEELMKCCPGPDDDPLDGCRPVDCHKKYNGNKNYFSSLKNLCTTTPTCYSDPDKELPDVAYVPTCNECIDLEQPLAEEDMRRLLRTKSPNETHCKASAPSTREYGNIRCHHGVFNSDTKMCDCDIGWGSAPIPEDLYLPSTLHLHFCTIRVPSGQFINTDPVLEALIDQEPGKVILSALYLSLILVLLVILCIGFEKRMSTKNEKKESRPDSERSTKDGDVILNFFTVADSSDESERFHLKPEDNLNENIGNKQKGKRNNSNKEKKLPAFYEKSLVVYKCRDKRCIGDLRFISGHLQRKKCGYFPENVKYHISSFSETSMKKEIGNSIKRNDFPISGGLGITKRQTYISRSPLKRLLKSCQQLFAKSSVHMNQVIVRPRNYNSLSKLFRRLKDKVTRSRTKEFPESGFKEASNFSGARGSHPIWGGLSNSRTFKDELPNKLLLQKNINTNKKSERHSSPGGFLLNTKGNSLNKLGVGTSLSTPNHWLLQRTDVVKENSSIPTASEEKYFQLRSFDESIKSTCVGSQLQENTLAAVTSTTLPKFNDPSKESLENTCYSALKFVENSLSKSSDSSEIAVESAKGSRETLKNKNPILHPSVDLKSQPSHTENSPVLIPQISEHNVNQSDYHSLRKLSQIAVNHENDFKETLKSLSSIPEQSEHSNQINLQKNCISNSPRSINEFGESVLSDLLSKARETLQRSKNDSLISESGLSKEVLYRLFKRPNQVSRSYIPVLKSGRKAADVKRQSERRVKSEGLTVHDGSNGKKEILPSNSKRGPLPLKLSSESSLSYEEVSFKLNDLRSFKMKKNNNQSAKKMTRSKKHRTHKERMLNPYEKASQLISKCLKYIPDKSTKIKASDIMSAFCKSPNFFFWKNMLRINGIESVEDDLKRAYNKINYLERTIINLKKFFHAEKLTKNKKIKRVRRHEKDCLLVFCNSEGEAKRYSTLAKHLLAGDEVAVPLDPRIFPFKGLVRLGPGWPIRHLVAALQAPGGQRKAFILTASPDTLDNLERLAVSLARVRLHRELRIHHPSSNELYTYLINNLITTKRKSVLTRKLPHLFILWRALMLVPQEQIDCHTFARAMNFLSTIFQFKMTPDAQELYSNLIRAESIFLDFYCAKPSIKNKKIPFKAIELLLKNLSTMKQREAVLDLVTEQVESISQSISLTKNRPMISNVASQLKRDLENALSRYRDTLNKI